MQKAKWEGERDGCGNRRGGGGFKSLGVDCVVGGLLIKLKHDGDGFNPRLGHFPLLIFHLSHPFSE